LLFFDNELLEHTVKQTNLYAEQHAFRRANYTWYDTSVSEMGRGRVTISTGLVSLPNLQDYWKKEINFSQPGIVTNMP